MSEKELNTEDELNDLKSLWKNQPDEKSYDSTEIFKMIHRKSINSVQWLFIITFIEFLIGLVMSLWTIFGNNFYSQDRIQTVGPEVYEKLVSLSQFGLIGSLVIFGITFYFYHKISSAMAVHDLMKNIIKFRMSVFAFIFIWILGILILFVPLMIEMGINTYINNNLNQGKTLEEVQNIAKSVGYIFAGITVFSFLLFSAIYYGIIYGIFLRRLGRNLKELKKIEN